MLDLENELLKTFQLSKIDDQKFMIELCLPQTLTYFHGHFPDFPVLPAVAFVDISVLFIEKCFGVPRSRLASIPSVKIKKILTPLVPIQIILQQQEPNHFQLDWAGFAILNLVFGPQPSDRQEHKHPEASEYLKNQCPDS